MKGPTKERWRTLCEQAVDEQDPQRFMELITELNRLLSAKEERLKLNRLLSGKEERIDRWHAASEGGPQLAWVMADVKQRS